MFINSLLECKNINVLEGLLNKHSNLIDALPVNLFIKDNNYKSRWGNKGQLEILKLSSVNDYHMKEDFELMSHEFASKVRCNDRVTLNGRNKCCFIEEGVIHGKRFRGLNQKSPIYGHTGKVIGLFGVSFLVDQSEDKEKNDIEVYQAAGLTKREAECVQLTTRGCSAKETAIILKISHRTVEIYLNSAKRKLNSKNKHELVSNANLLLGDKFIV